MAITMYAAETMSVVTAMPAVTADLHGDSLYGAAFSAYMLANLVALVVAGEHADRHGPAPPFVAGVTVFAAGLLVAGLAPTMVVVVGGRALQGAGAGTLASLAYVAVGRAWPADEQPRIFAWLSAAWIVPSLVAPAAAGLVSERLGWRWVFLGLLPLLPLVAALALPSLRTLKAPPAPSEARPSRVPAALGLATGVGLVVAGLASARLVVFVSLVGIGIAATVVPLRRLFPEGALRAASGTGAAVAVRLCVGMAFFGADTYVPLIATRIHGSGTLTAGLVIMSASFTWTAGAARAARLAGRRDPAVIVRVGFLLILAGIALTMPVLSTRVSLVVAFFTWAVAGFGIGLVFNTTSVAAMGTAPLGREGVVSSQLQIADTLGVAVMGGVGGALVGLADRTDLTLSAALAIQLGLAGAIAVVGALIAPRMRAATDGS
jgi:predicted MFS family arabinose efflux permease